MAQIKDIIPEELKKKLAEVRAKLRSFETKELRKREGAKSGDNTASQG